MLTPFTLREIGWRGLRAEWAFSRGWTVLAGFTSLSAYALVLLAMARGTPASYAGAIREFSVVLGAGYGVLVLKEEQRADAPAGRGAGGGGHCDHRAARMSAGVEGRADGG